MACGGAFGRGAFFFTTIGALPTELDVVEVAAEVVDVVAEAVELVVEDEMLEDACPREAVLPFLVFGAWLLVADPGETATPPLAPAAGAG